MYCPECGHHNPEAARFCGRCGASLIEGVIEGGDGEKTMTFAPPAEAGADTGVMEAVAEGPTLVIWLGGGRSGEHFSVGGERTSIGPTKTWIPSVMSTRKSEPKRPRCSS